jgi:hypothetical protein
MFTMVNLPSCVTKWQSLCQTPLVWKKFGCFQFSIRNIFKGRLGRIYDRNDWYLGESHACHMIRAKVTVFGLILSSSQPKGWVWHCWCVWPIQGSWTNSRTCNSKILDKIEIAFAQITWTLNYLEIDLQFSDDNPRPCSTWSHCIQQLNIREMIRYDVLQWAEHWPYII